MKRKDVRTRITLRLHEQGGERLSHPLSKNQILLQRVHKSGRKRTREAQLGEEQNGVVLHKIRHLLRVKPDLVLPVRSLKLRGEEGAFLLYALEKPGVHRREIAEGGVPAENRVEHLPKLDLDALWLCLVDHEPEEDGLGESELARIRHDLLALVHDPEEPGNRVDKRVEKEGVLLWNVADAARGKGDGHGQRVVEELIGCTIHAVRAGVAAEEGQRAA